jgi:hypothetical protein
MNPLVGIFEYWVLCLVVGLVLGLLMTWTIGLPWHQNWAKCTLGIGAFAHGVMMPEWRSLLDCPDVPWIDGLLLVALWCVPLALYLVLAKWLNFEDMRRN